MSQTLVRGGGFGTHGVPATIAWMKSPTLILASGSPRRRELLTEAGYEFAVIVPGEDVECGLCSERGPAGLVSELAYRKAAVVRESLKGQGDRETRRQGEALGDAPSLRTRDEFGPVIVAADTVAECDGLVLGKPRDVADARTMLRQLRGREHRVLTGLCVWPLADAEPIPAGPDRPWPVVRVAVTQLRMDALSDAEIEQYLAMGQWEGKAGGFGYQDRLGWVRVESGSESNVVGLPMELLAELLAELESR